jgi:hypothetical protein
LAALLLVGASIAAAGSSRAAKPVSTDGEATIYVTGDFVHGFDLAYNALLRPMPANRGDIFVGIMLTGHEPHGPGIELGLNRDAVNPRLVRVFLSLNARHAAPSYTSFPARCTPACELILRGDRYGLYAAVITEDGIQNIGAWSRAAFSLVQPYVQLNGEVTKPGDRIFAVLTPMRTVANSENLARPTCAFTTRGIVPRREPGGLLIFSGAYRTDAPSSFIDLKTGRMVDRCPHS